MMCYNTDIKYIVCEKVGNAHPKLLAYPSFDYIQTMQNGKVSFAQFPIA